MLRPTRLLVALATIAVVAIVGTAAAFAHTGLTPDEAAPGTVITLELSVQNERPDSGTTQVQLLFPDGTPIAVVELPPVEGWTATVDGASLGEPATGVTWTRPDGPPGENPVLPLRLGPLPAEEGRLQFKVVQTYANGDVDRWIEDWPAGAPEPERPGPVLDLVAGGPGDPAPPTTAAPTTATTEAPTTSTEGSTTTTVAAEVDDADDGAPVAALVVGALVIAALAGTGVWFRARRAGR